MNDSVQALQDQVDELAGLIADLDEEGFATESACPGWSVADVLVHLAQTNEAATASVHGRLHEMAGLFGATGDGDTVDEDAAAAVEAAAGTTGAAAAAWWQQSCDDMVAAFAGIDPAARVQWVVGDMASRTLCSTRISETWIHTIDIADGLDVNVAPTDRLWHVARLVHRTIPYSFIRAGEDAPGSVRFDLVGPDGTGWTFGDEGATTVISGSAHELCTVAGQRGDAADTGLTSSGPDGPGVLRLMRTFA